MSKDRGGSHMAQMFIQLLAASSSEIHRHGMYPSLVVLPYLYLGPVRSHSSMFVMFHFFLGGS